MQAQRNVSGPIRQQEQQVSQHSASLQPRKRMIRKRPFIWCVTPCEHWHNFFFFFFFFYRDCRMTPKQHHHTQKNSWLLKLKEMCGNRSRLIISHAKIFLQLCSPFFFKFHTCWPQVVCWKKGMLCFFRIFSRLMIPYKPRPFSLFASSFFSLFLLTSAVFTFFLSLILSLFPLVLHPSCLFFLT